MTSSYHNQELDVGLGIYHYSCVATYTQHTVYAMSNCQPHKPGDRKTSNCHCPPRQLSRGNRHNPHQRATKPPCHPDPGIFWCDNPYCCHLHRHVGAHAEMSEKN